MTQFSFEWILSLNCLCQKRGQVQVSLNKPFFETKTDAEGRFSLESVSPGRYLLGSNIIGLNTSSVPSTYYPRQRSRTAAIPVEVRLGDTVDNLLFTLPDFGELRAIQICVVDENGRPVTSAKIASDTFHDARDDSASLGEELTTNETGCVKVQGFTRAAYVVDATIRPPGGDIWQTRTSDSLVIEPGEESVHKILVLGKPLGSKRTKQ